MPEATTTFDPSRKRPLELRIRDLYDEGGISENDAKVLAGNRLPADALFIIRAMIDEGTVALQQYSIVGGANNAQVGTEMLFNFWVALGGYLVREGTAETDEERRKKQFVTAVLFKLKLDNAFIALQDGLSPEDAMAQANELVPTEATP